MQQNGVTKALVHPVVSLKDAAEEATLEGRGGREVEKAKLTRLLTLRFDAAPLLLTQGVAGGFRQSQAQPRMKRVDSVPLLLTQGVAGGFRRAQAQPRMMRRS